MKTALLPPGASATGLANERFRFASAHAPQSLVGSGSAMPTLSCLNILDHIDTAILITDARLESPGPQIVYANGPFLQMSGYTLDELLGQTPRILQGPATSRETLALMRQSLAAHGHFKGEIINYRKDGTPYTIEWNLEPLRDATGEITHWIASQRDITAKRRAEEMLRKREELYRLITENSQDLICLLDRVGRFRYVSPSYQRTLGYNPHDLQGTDSWALIHPDDRSIICGLWHVLTTHGSALVTFRYRHAQGGWFWFEAQGAIFEYDGEWCIFLTCHDITRRRWAEEAYRESELRLLMAVRDAPIMIFALDRSGRITLAEGHVLQQLQIAGDALIGESIFEQYYDIPPLIENVYRALAGWSVSTRFVMAKTPFEAWMTPIRAEDGSVSGVVIVAIDISVRQSLEADLLQAQKMEIIGQLAGGLAHDFNNLLTVVQVAADLILATAPANSSYYHDAHLIQQSTRRAATLTRRLLMFAGQESSEQQVVDLRALVQDLLPLMHSIVGPTIKIVVDDTVPVGAVFADTTQLEQVLINLVANARDAMPSGGTLTISITSTVQEIGYHYGDIQREPGLYTRLSISDTGIGMSEEVRTRIFEPFFTTKDRHKGTGIGLATCYRIIAQHHGRITVQSVEHQGSTFQIDLPALRELAPSPRLPDDPPGDLPGGSETVLLVDDEPAILALTARQLRLLGYTVLEAITAEAAMQQLAQHRGPIDLLVTDLRLPDRSGLILAEQVRRIQPSVMKVIFISGYSSQAVVLQGAPKSLPVAFLAKPFTPAALAHTIRRVLK